MLSINAHLILSPWFKKQTLIKAEHLLASKECLVIFYRNACAAVFKETAGYCLINFQAVPQIWQAFRLDNGECSICGHRQTITDYCPHIAALTIRTISERNGKPFSAPMLFADSSWRQVSAFLNEQGGNPAMVSDGKRQLLLHNEALSAEVALEEKYLSLLAILFPKLQAHGFNIDEQIDQQAVCTAWERLFDLCRSDNEKTINRAARLSNGQKKAKSLWTQLCRQLFMAQPRPNWRVQRFAGHQFVIQSCAADGIGLRLTPSRQQLMPLLDRLALRDQVVVKGQARAYSRIYFQEDGSLTIEPRLQLANGDQRRRRDLRECIFGKYCSVHENVFEEIVEQEEDFSLPAKSSSLPLLAFSEKREPDATITIAAPEVPDFLEVHLAAISSGRHEADAALQEFRVVDLPDRIEVRSYHEDDDWCYLNARYACGGRHLDLQEILGLRRQGQRHATGRGKWLQLRNTPLDWLYDRAPERLQKDGNGVTMRLTRLEMLALTSLVPQIELPEDKKRREPIAQLLHNLKHSELVAADMPSHLRVYQQTGLAWMQHLCDNGIGGILADEMGLGKTHQALALIDLVLRRYKGPALVVCPASVLPHWQGKIDTFYSGLDYEVYYGPQRRLSHQATSKLIITTYAIVRQDIALLQELSFGLIVYDEIQYLKNKQSATSRAAACLQGRVCFGLSGTPIENSLADLKSIYDICLPGLLGDSAYFNRTYVRPIEENRNQGRLEALRRLTGPFMLRRNKSIVLQELPDEIEDIRYCYLSSEQQSLYQQVIEQKGRDLLEAAGDTNAPFPHMNFLALIQQLKQICNHPCQLANSTDYEQYRSGKWELFKEILNECLDADIKVVVFSQYTAMLDIIEQYLRDRRIAYAGLRGSTSVKTRRQLIQSFNDENEIKVFCASLLAGGTGIDLTGAQAVIHYDRWWNSAREEQATARVHRFGQKQAVQVFKFITTGTLEEKIHRLIHKKQDLAKDAIMSDEGTIIKKLSRQEIASILHWTPLEMAS